MGYFPGTNCVCVCYMDIVFGSFRLFGIKTMLSHEFKLNTNSFVSHTKATISALHKKTAECAET